MADQDTSEDTMVSVIKDSIVSYAFILGGTYLASFYSIEFAAGLFSGVFTMTSVFFGSRILKLIQSR